MVKKFAVNAAVALLSSAAFAANAAFPDRPFKLIVPFSAGTSTDVLAREFAQAMSAVVKQPVIVENKTGAEGTIGGQTLLNAERDGYTLMLTSSSLTVLDPLVKKNLPYDPTTDFTPLCSVARAGNVLNMSCALAFKNIAEFLTAAKGQPGKFTFAYSTTTTRAAGELFSQASGVKLLGVPYRSSAAGLADVAGGQVDLFFIDHVSASPFYQSGKIKPLLVAGSKRDRSLPDVPSAAEAGIPGYEMLSWFGVYTASKTPTPVIQQLRDAMVLALKTPHLKAKIKSAGMEDLSICGDALANYQSEEMERARQVFKKAGIRPE